MRLITQGLVLKVQDTGESDRLLTILTRDYGVLRAFANGAKKLKSNSLSAAQPLCYSNFTIYSSRNANTVDEAQSIEVFFKLREDIEALSLAQYFCELAMEFAPQDSPAEEFLRLMLSALYVLAQKKRPQRLIKSVVELRTACLAGYMPDLSACSVCQAPTLPDDHVFFSATAGVLHCAACGKQPGDMQISMSTLEAMRYICTAPPDKLFSFKMPEFALQALEKTCERYILAQGDRGFQTLTFYHSIRTT